MSYLSPAERWFSFLLTEISVQQISGSVLIFGTLLGAISGSILPDFIMSALGVAIYGMFLAVIIPPSKKNKAVLLVVLGAMAVSALFAWVPVLSKVSSGFVIIITTILVAGLAAWLCPVDEENAKEEAHEA